MQGLMMDMPLLISGLIQYAADYHRHINAAAHDKSPAAKKHQREQAAIYAKKISQVNACGPLLATAPSVSTPMIVHNRKNKMSNRAKCLRSFFFSASASVVVTSTRSPGAAIDAMAHLPCASAACPSAGSATQIIRMRMNLIVNRGSCGYNLSSTQT